MADYKAPLRDINFVLKEFLNSEQHYASLQGCERPDMDVVDAVIGRAPGLPGVVGPMAANGDEQGCKFDGGKVTTPDGFREAFRQWGEGGWQSWYSVEEGGQGLPSSIGTVMAKSSVRRAGRSACMAVWRWRR